MKKSLLQFFALLWFSRSMAWPVPLNNQPEWRRLDQKSLDRVYKEVRHELVMLPYYGVFDNLSYKVDPMAP
jgi:hypothetical protein